MDNRPAAKTASLAIWSFALAVAGVVLIGPLGTIPAIICGHVALPRINRSSGALTGRGLAIAGIAIGYVGTVIFLMIIVAVALPSFCNVRDKARQIKCMANLKMIGSAAELHAVDNQDEFPSHLQSIAGPEYGIDPEVFVCPATGHKPGEMAQVDAWSDYVLVPGRKRDDPTDTVLAFSKAECYPGEGGNVLFVGGHVEWCELEDYESLTTGLTH